MDIVFLGFSSGPFDRAGGFAVFATVVLHPGWLRLAPTRDVTSRSVTGKERVRGSCIAA
jgi:hypothetical protein